MKVKAVVTERYQDYKYPAMMVAFPNCSFKCDKENGVRCCQNSELALTPSYEIKEADVVQMYMDNHITKAIVFGGLEPFDSWTDMLLLIDEIRSKTNDDIVIYTGYNKNEIIDKVIMMSVAFGNIIIKYGRFVPNRPHRFDDVLGVELASDNQYAEKIS